MNSPWTFQLFSFPAHLKIYKVVFILSKVTMVQSHFMFGTSCVLLRGLIGQTKCVLLINND